MRPQKPATDCRQGMRNGLAYVRGEDDYTRVSRAMWVQHGIETTRRIVRESKDSPACYLVLIAEPLTDEYIETAIDNKGLMLRPLHLART